MFFITFTSELQMQCVNVKCKYFIVIYQKQRGKWILEYLVLVLRVLPRPPPPLFYLSWNEIFVFAFLQKLNFYENLMYR